MTWKVLTGDAVEVLADAPENSIDAIVTDPPYGLKFMGKDWDDMGSGRQQEEWHRRWAEGAYRVLKPGGHLLAFGGTRTYHRLASAVEDAGFEIRDQMQGLYGTGFPKSLNISKAIDKAAGAERTEVIGTKIGLPGVAKDGRNQSFDTSRVYGGGKPLSQDVTAPATEEAARWDGWGTALKPANEPIVVARKPLVGAVAKNVVEWGTGGLNIEAARIAADDGYEKRWNTPVSTNIGSGMFDPETNEQRVTDLSTYKPSGRWPANVLLDDEAAAMLDAQVGATPGPARFFYVAKASKAEREAGLTPDEGKKRANNHPTVKPAALMEYLVRLVTPPGGVVLDPFAGSGSTGIAAVRAGFNFIGVELDAEYAELARKRIAYADTQGGLVP